MKTKIIFLMMSIGIFLGTAAQSQSRLDSVLVDNLADLNSVNLYDVCYEFKDLIKQSIGRVITADNFQVLGQGKNLCLISHPRTHLQIFIENYLFKKEKFSIVLLNDDQKFVYLISQDGNGGYYKKNQDGYLVFNSLFVGGDLFMPMNRNEIAYFNERFLKSLRLILLAGQ